MQIGKQFFLFGGRDKSKIKGVMLTNILLYCLKNSEKGNIYYGRRIIRRVKRVSDCVVVYSSVVN